MTLFNKSENIFHNSMDHGSNECKPLELTLIPSICNRYTKDNESIQTKQETVEVLNICN